MTGDSDHRFLDVVSTPNQIHNLPVNRSVSKQLYSFPKASRFPEMNFRPQCSEAFYDIPSSLLRSNRACSLGKGQKFDFTKITGANPAPNAYNVVNDTVEKNSSLKASIGISRDMAPQFGILPHKASNLPGPGAYDPKEPRSQRTTQFRIRPKLPADFSNSNGPGAYDILKCFDPTKKMPLSQFRSVSNVKISPVSAVVHREQHQAELYSDTKFQMNKTGVFFNSKYKNSMCRSFGKSARSISLKKDSLPGPGDYRLPSDFGFYQSSTASKHSRFKENS